MDFRDAKELCKHAAPATKCPVTFKDCNADNCPMCFTSALDDEDCDRYCPIIDKYRDDARLAKAYKDKYKELLEQCATMQQELTKTIEAHADLVNSTLLDLRDKLQTSCKRLEP